ncbi:sugar ABC transporter permease [Paenibacillus psychroresistens]|uniref:Sugar ABC transporter permease n=1 Tax=Paenibacillus psychroresistens TaxID=1778678 RepID=A0A6B8RD57_9BACL|nr:sugar ABC transporter permease [Paenibacillus psychroresistens]QGQ94381.1 sugar ABC transporter permease [Paenibacillus psychroresistens]
MNDSAVPIQQQAAIPKRKVPLSLSIKKHFWGYVFLLPALYVFIQFLWVPIVKSFFYSVQIIDFVNGNTYVGFDNFKRALHNPDLLVAIKNTAMYMGMGVVVGFWVPIFFAIAISEMRKFQGFARVAAYLPNVIPIVVLYGLWQYLYDPDIGPFNYFLGKLGIGSISFLSDEKWSMISIVFMETWQSFGGAMLIYLAAVLSIPRDWYEAAEIDGAGVWARIRHITLPAISNLMILMLILQLIATSQGFQAQQALLEGGPGTATLTYSLLIIRYAFTDQDYGTASAMGVMMFFLLSGLAIMQFKLFTRGEN